MEWLGILCAIVVVGIMFALWAGRFITSHAGALKDALKELQDHSIGRDRLKKNEGMIGETLVSVDAIRKSQKLLLDQIFEVQSQQKTTQADSTRFNASMAKVMKDMPSKTLRTIQGSVNNTTGKLGEMMTLIELQQQWDRLIVVGDIVDFIGVKFPTADAPGQVSFIDVKTGKGAALSADQRKFKKLVDTDASVFKFEVVKVLIT
jgi:predicted Holliday junction resolvase-like endonuclease